MHTMQHLHCRKLQLSAKGRVFNHEALWNSYNLATVRDLKALLNPNIFLGLQSTILMFIIGENVEM